jgi:hypothetical protein
MQCSDLNQINLSDFHSTKKNVYKKDENIFLSE